MADKFLDKDGLESFASGLKTKLDATYEKKGEGGSGYTKAETDALLLGKVDKVDGKGLSTNDYSDDDKSSVGEISGLKENLTELEQKAITSTEEESYEPTVPRDADTLGGIGASEYALKSEIFKSKYIQEVDADSTGNIDLDIASPNEVISVYASSDYLLCYIIPWYHLSLQKWYAHVYSPIDSTVIKNYTIKGVTVIYK